MRRSESIGQIAAALALAQQELKAAPRDAVLDTGKFRTSYATLASVAEACRDALAANGLAVSQGTRRDEAGELVLETLLMHASGEWAAADVPLYFDAEGRTAMQALGSAISYARRYGLAALVGAWTEDDDGQAAGTPAQRQAAPARGNGHVPESAPEPWAKYLIKLLDQWNKFEPIAAGDDKSEVEREHRIVQALATAMVKAKVCAEADLLKPAEPGKPPARDPRKVFEAVKRGYAEHPDWIRIQCRSYLIEKRDEARKGQPADDGGGSRPAAAPQPLPAPAAPDPGGDAAPPAGAAEGDRKPPRTGKALYAWAKETGEREEVGLLKYLNGWAKLQEFPARMVDWSDDQVALGYAEAVRKLKSIPADRGDAYEEALTN